MHSLLRNPPLRWVLVLAAIWAPVVYLLGAQWSAYEQYSYGWAVPFLCGLLAAQRLSAADCPPVTVPGRKKPAIAMLVLAALLYWAMRVLQEANPIWRVASWGLTLSAVAMTLAVIYLAYGGPRTVRLFFPVAFFLIAVPWPTPMESVTIQGLTTFNSGLVMEVLGLLGIPAILHGNVIEISNGMVGFDEACSGIRSLQATLMIALFFGAFYQLTRARRVGLMLAAPALALAFNLARTLTLTLVAAHWGMADLAKWHDPTGVALLLGCFFSLWLVALRLGSPKRPQKITARSSKFEVRNSEIQNRSSEIEVRRSVARSSEADPLSSSSISDLPSSALSPSLLSPALVLSLLAFALGVALATEAWFRSHEARGGGGPIDWSAQWPAVAADLRTNIIPPVALRQLACDRNTSASWSDQAGVDWQAFYLRWLPAETFYGRTRLAMAKSHIPSRCLPAAGMTLKAKLDPVSIPVAPGLSLPFDRLVFEAGGRELYVFFSQTEDLLETQRANVRLSHLARLQAALIGSRNYGERNLEVALAGPESPEAALQLVAAKLPQFVTIKN